MGIKMKNESFSSQISIDHAGLKVRMKNRNCS
jgi:hypothetical protein